MRMLDLDESVGQHRMAFVVSTPVLRRAAHLSCASRARDRQVVAAVAKRPRHLLCHRFDAWRSEGSVQHGAQMGVCLCGVYAEPTID